MAEIAIAGLIGGAIAAGATYLLQSGQPGQTREGARLTSSTLTTSTEGAGIPRLYGRYRLGGQIIWATEFDETVTTETTEVEGGGKGTPSQSVETTTYSYSISLAIAFAEGHPDAQLSRVWADGKEVDLSGLVFRFYPGSETQTPDPLIQSLQSTPVPAYRGVCYVVVEDMPLEEFGNRVPQITAEVIIPVENDDPDDIKRAGQSWCMIPGSGETTYDTVTQYRLNNYGDRLDETFGGGFTGSVANAVLDVGESSTDNIPDNEHNGYRQTDALRSLDILETSQENLDAILLVVSWFGTSTDAGACLIEPRHEGDDRLISPDNWTVGTYTRDTANSVSLDAQGRPVYGGTPSDAGVKRLIQNIRARGKRVIFYPFILMDAPGFPWRGRIEPTAGSVAADVNTWFNRYEAMINHYTALCSQAGGVDGFVIGSELRGLTMAYDTPGVFPAVARLQQLAATAKTALPSATITYAADWSEQVVSDSNGLYFHLDPLWADSNIDAIGIDNYLPLSDWRDGVTHADYNTSEGYRSEYDPEYLASQIEGGEYYDYFYASEADRAAQNRTPITDGDYNKPWVHRRKDFRNWWTNQHYNRPNWVESSTPTAWVPGSKPFWFTEFGVPAVDKGTNQPNVFYDPKSTESAYPYFSSGVRDDFIQRVGVEAMLKYWKNNSPTSGSLKMIERHNMFIWTWDARPYPNFPAQRDVWSDGDNWYKGHWWTGRTDSIPLHALVARLCRQGGLTDDQFDVTGLYGANALVRGFLLDRPEAIRRSLEDLMAAYLFDGYESEGKVKFLLRSNSSLYALDAENVVVSDSDPVGITLTRGQETELPTNINITFVDEFNDYNTASVDGKTARGYSDNVEQIELPITMTTDYVRSLADATVQQKWLERQRGNIVLPPSFSQHDPGDVFTIPVGGNTVTGRLTLINQGDTRESEFVGFDTGLFELPASPDDNRIPDVVSSFGTVQLIWLDIPVFTGQEVRPWAQRIASNASPWPGSVSVYRQQPDETFTFNTKHDIRNAIGVVTQPLARSAPHVWDRYNELNIAFNGFGAVSSVTELQALASQKAIGVYNATLNEWEIIQFATAQLTAPNAYKLTDLIRGQLGTEHAIQDEIPVDSIVVLLEPFALTAVNVSFDAVDDVLTYAWGPSRYAYTDNSYQAGLRQGKRVGLRPYAPGAVYATKASNDDVIITWKRRNRYNGDSWTVEELPYVEGIDRYRVRVFDGATQVHEAVVNDAETYTYTAAQQITDGITITDTLTVEIAQYGNDFGGYGIPYENTINIKGVV